MPVGGLRLIATYRKYKPHGTRPIALPGWNLDMKQQEYERHLRLAELTKQWYVQVEAPPYAAIKWEGWMYYDQDLFLLEI